MQPYENDTVKHMRIFKFIGFILLVIGLVLVVERTLFIWNAQEAEGVVIKMNGAVGRTSGYDTRFSANGKYRSISFPTIEFAVKGKNYTLDGSVVVGNLNLSNSKYEVNQNVNLLYDRKNPENAFINNSLELWSLPCLLLALGLIFLILIPLTIKTFMQLLTE